MVARRWSPRISRELIQIEGSRVKVAAPTDILRDIHNIRGIVAIENPEALSFIVKTIRFWMMMMKVNCRPDESNSPLEPIQRYHIFSIQIAYKANVRRKIMFAWLMNLMSKIFGNTAEMNMNQDQSGQAVAKGNWMGPDGTESGPNVPRGLVSDL